MQSRGVASGDVPVYLVERSEEQYRHLQRSLGAGTGCTPWRDVLAPCAGRATFHRASPAESGLLPPQTLQQLWPNVGAGDAVIVEAATCQPPPICCTCSMDMDVFSYHVP